MIISIIVIAVAILTPILVILNLNGSSQPFSFGWYRQWHMTSYGLPLWMFTIPPTILVLIWLIFWICMLIDCLARDYREFGTLITSDKSADKLVWVLLILFLPIIGAIAYHISVRRRPRSVEEAR